MYYSIVATIISLFFTIGVHSNSSDDNVLTHVAVDVSNQIDLTGKWHIAGGRLNFVVDIEDYGSSAEIWQISQYGNSDRNAERNPL